MALAAPGATSVGAGLEIASAGGNAVDAAVAAAVTAMATEPGIVSLMGGAYVSVWADGSAPEVVDGNVAMPGAGRPADAFGGGVREVRTAYGGGVTMFAGPGSVAVSGAVPALALASRRYGLAGWADLLAPAARACRHGFPIGSASAHYLGLVREVLFGADPEALALVSRSDGGALQPAEPTTNVRLALTLELLADEGPECLTTGEIGRALVDAMDAGGGLVTHEDLRTYEPVVREPVRRALGDWQVALNPPPSVGGPMLAVMLGELARVTDWSWSDVVRIQRAVLAYRHRVHDTSTDLDADGHALLASVERHGLAGLPTSASTAHVSAVDADGLGCAVTMSSGYGAGMVVPDTGLLLNNALGEPELNRLGLHALAPGTRLASNMAPTTARTGDGRVLAAGSPGADRITTALMQVLGQGCLHGADLQEAIDAPRVHVRTLPGGDAVVEYERDPGIAAAVALSGLPGHEHPEPSMYFGGVGAALLDADGALVAAADPRRASATGVS